jgi:hypothetical protein
MFANAKPPTTEPLYTPVVNPKPGERLRVLITGDFLWTFTHYYTQRTWPCVQHRCPLCKRQIPRRLYAFLPCLTTNGQAAIVQLTALSAGELKQIYEPTQDDPIGVLTLERQTKQKNSHPTITFSPASPELRTKANNAEKPDVATAMLRVWKLKPKDPNEDDTDYSTALAAAIEQQISQKSH